MVVKNSAKAAVRPARIFIVDDHPIVRDGLTLLINHEPNMEVCGSADSVCGATRQLAKLAPDAIIVDLSLKEGSGMELLKDIKVRYPDMPALVLSLRDESVFAERSLRAGARGYIMKESSSANLIAALRTVLDGEIYLSENMSRALLLKLTGAKPSGVTSDIESLTDRELEILRMLGCGQTTRHIAEKLHRSIKTIESHRENIKRKLGCNNASELIQHAVRWVESGP